MNTVSSKRILFFIVLSQFAGTSLWFVGNAVLPELKLHLHLSQYAVSYITSAVMLGFIVGTLLISFLSVADRFSPVKIFFISSILGALFNTSVAWFATNAFSLFVLRFFTGFFIAGIYPVGMKIAADWYDKNLGKAMGFLLGALMLGTAFPHLLRNRSYELPWEWVLYATSLFAIVGGICMLLFVGDGPYRKKSGSFQWNAIGEIYKSKPFRQAAYGYFGHMWELYTFWGFLPIILLLYSKSSSVQLNIPLLSFLIIATGSVGSVLGGYISQKKGSAWVALMALSISGICCFISPFIFTFPTWLFLSFLFLWGFTVSPDSPQFSTLVAQYAPQHLKGTALTIYNAIGFSISTISLIIMDRLYNSTYFISGKNAFFVLGFGALLSIPSILYLVISKPKR